ncbi:MAG: peptide chain release factor N(5)-glutamine methyltransferase [Acidimicrobiia bacterium]|nr:peptide chain release factor N(5)-glutamine methyltransferase [Acidimicrobiia bacterium]
MRADAEAQLRAMGVHDPVAESRWLLEAVTGMDVAEQILESEGPATRRATAELDALLARRAAGEPIQYVLGAWTFCDLELLIDPRVLIPRPETEVVAQIGVAEVERLGERVGAPEPWGGGLTHYAVADLGTGAAALALALAASLPDAEVWATDVSEPALAVAHANIAASGTLATRVRVAHGSWFDALPLELRGSLLVVVSNPPYIADHEVLPASVVDWEPSQALISGPTGLEAVEHLLTTAPEWLDEAGTLVLEVAPHQAEPAMSMAWAAGFAEVFVRPDLAGHDRALVARRRADR